MKNNYLINEFYLLKKKSFGDIQLRYFTTLSKCVHLDTLTYVFLELWLTKIQKYEIYQPGSYMYPYHLPPLMVALLLRPDWSISWRVVVLNFWKPKCRTILLNSHFL